MMREPQKLRSDISRRANAPAGFSLIELVIVVVIIGIVAAIAIPRLSNSAKAAGASAVAGTLNVLQQAIEHYAAEHGGQYPSVINFTDQMTRYTDGNGNTANASSTVYIYGPYLRSMPPMPAGPNKGSTRVAATPAATVGWIFNAGTGQILPNLFSNGTISSQTISDLKISQDIVDALNRISAGGTQQPIPPGGADL